MRPWPQRLRWRSCIPFPAISAAAVSFCCETHKGKTTFIDFREKAPLAATETMYQDAKGNVIPDASLVGYRSIATPGSVAGLVYAEGKYGKLGLKRVIAPAIRLAREGFQLSGEETEEMKDQDALALCRFEAHFPAERRFLQGRRNPKAAGTGAHIGAH